MSDRLTLSCWVRNNHPLTRLSHWEKLLALFPYSQLGDRPATVRVLAVDYQEPVQFERTYPAPVTAAALMPAFNDFQAADTAWIVETHWDLMKFEAEEEWKLGPVPVTLWSFGPEFTDEAGDHLRVEFGLEEWFLPRPEEPESIRPAQVNLLSLTRLVQEMGRALPIDRKHLWSESGVNFAEKLQAAVRGERLGLSLQ